MLQVCKTLDKDTPGAPEGRDRQIREFSSVFTQFQDHISRHARVMGCGDALYHQNMRMMVAAAFGSSMDAKHLKKLKVQAELQASIQDSFGVLKLSSSPGPFSAGPPGGGFQF
eukprot:1502694-Rhodomonas_salina.1